MRHRKFNKSFIVLLFTTMLLSSASILFNKENIGYAKLTPEEAQSEDVGNLSYGYNVTAGVPMYDHYSRQNRILRPVYEKVDGDALADHIERFTGSLNSEAVVGLSENVTSTINQSKRAISGGINAKVSVVNFDVDAKFDTQTDVTRKYKERYETYYKKIEHSSYIIDGKVDLRNYLDPDFKQVLESVATEADAYRIFDDYGTHLLTSIVMGGLLEVCNYQVSGEESEKLSNGLQIGASIDLIMAASAGGDFNYDETIMQEQNKGNKASTYKCHLWGGTKTIADLSLSQLFQYHQPSLNVPGEFEYTRWQRSIGRGENLSILGIYPNTKTVPVWDLFPSSAQYNKQRLLLLNSYKKRCGNRYDEFLKKYPEKARTENLDSEKYGTATLDGYSLTKDGLTTYHKNNTDAPNNYYVYPGSEFSLNYEDTIPEEKKEWRIEGDGLYINVKDPKEGIFKVDNNIPEGSEFTIAIYNADTMIENYTFKVKKYLFSGGDGTIEDPYKISSLTDYANFYKNSQYWNQHFELIKDINCERSQILPVGEKANPFTGSFNGNNCSIYNFNISEPRGSVNTAIGLFAYNRGDIKNLKVGKETFTTEIKYIEETNVDIKKIEYAGALVGYNEGNLDNCAVINVSVDIKDYFSDDNEYNLYVGSLVGFSTNYMEKSSNITKCSAQNINLVQGKLFRKDKLHEGTIHLNVGGFIGGITKTAVSNCYLNSASTIMAQGRCKHSNVITSGFIASVTSDSSLNTCISGNIEKMVWGADANYNDTGLKTLLVGIDAASIKNCFVNPYKEQLDTGCIAGCEIKEKIDTTTCNLNDIWYNSDNFVVIVDQTLDKTTPIVYDITGIKNYEVYKGKSLNLAGLKIKAKKIDGNYYTINTFGINLNGFDSNKLDVGQNIIIDALGYTTNLTIKVRKIKVSGIYAEQKEGVIIYPKGELNKDNMNIYYVLEDGTRINIENPKNEETTIYPTATTPVYDYDELVFGQNKVNIRLGALETNAVINVEKDPLTSLEILEKPTREYHIGDNYSIEGVKVQATYMSGRKTIADNDQIEVIGNSFMEGENVVSLSYEDYNTVCEDKITVVKTEHTIIFQDYDGTEISKNSYGYGDTVKAPKDPVRPSDNTYTYTFTGWDKKISTVTGDAVYTATYSKEYIDYIVKFVDEDGTIISEKNYHYGDNIVVPNNPSKQADKTYTYIFAGWDSKVVNCDGSKTYTATYNKNYIDYTITFVDDNGDVISKKTYHYDDIVSLPDTPIKPSDKIYNYTFKGWDKEVLKVTGNETYTATYNKNYIDYTITFVDDNGNIISQKTYHYGESITLPNIPSKEADKTYTYTFKGWDQDIVNCDGDKTYTATYNKKYIEYTIKFVDEDGNVILEKTYHYGDEIITPANPSKESDKTYTYTFKGWDNEIVNCDGDKTYTATYNKNYIDYTIKFVDEDGTVILEKTYHYGDKVIIPNNPNKPSDKTYTYTFKGWDKEVVNCDGNKTYTATYKNTYIEYTVKFVDENGNVILEKTYHYGDEIITPANPSKESDKTYTYTFNGWDTEVVNCDGNKTYTAQFNKEYIEYIIIFKNYDGTIIKSVAYHYGDVIDFPTEFKRPVDTEKIKYEFIGWGNNSLTCEGNAEYKPQFKEIKAVITIIFKNEDGTVISTTEYQNGDIIVSPDKPTKPSDAKYNYIFKGWDKEVGFAKEDTVFTAVYTQEDRLYKVTFVDEDGNIISENYYKYNETINAPTPTKDATDKGSYKFTGWDKEIKNVIGDVTYTAQFEFIAKEKNNVLPIVAGSVGGAGLLGLAIWVIIILKKKMLGK